MAISVGSVAVDVVPSAEGFRERLNAQLRDLPSVRIVLDATQATTRIEIIRTQIRSISSTSAKLNVDTSEFDAKIAAIKAEINSIKSTQLNVDVDTARANAKIAALRVQEKGLKDDISRFQSQNNNNAVPVDQGRQLAAIQAQLSALHDQRLAVRVDTAEADAKLATLRAELDVVTRNRQIKIDTSPGDSDSVLSSLKSKIDGIDSSAASAAAGAIGKFTLIGVAILALIPIAAAASIAIAGIGAGLGLGILGLLVGKLALGGVGSALSASNAPTGGGSGVSAAQAADTQRQAEVALTVAQRNAIQAQLDLTQARLAAIQTLQDLSNQVTDNGLAQRQAVLDLQTAQRNLQVAKANPDAQNPANAGALAQVQLAADQAQQNLTELQEKGQSLAQQQAAAVAAGVDGAASVIAAQNQVTDSQNALTEAQFQAANGSAAAAGGLTAYQQAMAKLDPVQQNFVRFLQGIQPQLDGVKDAAADSFLPLLQTAITNLLPLLPQVTSILGKVGGAFGDLAIKASGFFTSPDGQKFLDFISNNVGPAIATFGSVVGGAFKLAADVFEQAYPLIKQFGDAFAGALGDADKGVKGGALNGFFDYIIANEPQIKKTLEDVGGAIVSIFKSFGPDAPAALKAVSSLAKDLAALAKVVAPIIKDLLPFAPVILAIVGVFQLLAPLIAVGGPIGLGIAGVIAGGIALGAALIYLYNHSKDFRDIVNDIALFLLNDLLPAAENIGGFFANAFVSAIQAAIDIVNNILGAVEGIASTFDKAYGVVSGWVSDVVNVITGLPGDITALGEDMLNAGATLLSKLGQGLSGAVSGVGDVAKSIVNAVIDGINNVVIDPLKGIKVGAFGVDVKPFSSLPDIPHLAKGGPIGGIGGPTSDSQLIAASPGEYMLNAAAYAKYPGLAHAMNSGQKIKSGINQINNFNGITDPNEVIAGVSRRLQFAGA